MAATKTATACPIYLHNQIDQKNQDQGTNQTANEAGNRPTYTRAKQGPLCAKVS